MASIFYSITAWLAPIVESMGYSKQEAGALLTLFTLIQIPVSIIIPLLAAKYKRRTLWLVLYSLSELTGVVMLIAWASPVASAILLGIGEGGLFPLALILPMTETQRPEEVSSWSAMNQGGSYSHHDYRTANDWKGLTGCGSSRGQEDPAERKLKSLLTIIRIVSRLFNVNNNANPWMAVDRKQTAHHSGRNGWPDLAYPVFHRQG